jgi:glycosyltransferase involved in cell wall biosynthesis
MDSNQRIAFVIDALPSLGGGEKVLFTALEAFPNADLFTLVYNRDEFVRTPIAKRMIRTSFIDRVPFTKRHHRIFLPLMPLAVSRFDLHVYDTIVSFSYAVAHGARSRNGARHVSYTFTPMRYAWTDLNLDGTRTRRNWLIDKYLQSFRKWDRRAASRVHEFAAISQAVSRRIADAYRRKARVIHPPVELERFAPAQIREDYYITVTRLVAHKRVDILLRAFSEMNLPLVIVGEGPELGRLKDMAGPNIHFLGYQSDERVAELLRKARAFVCATEEDFGIAIVEAQAAGCPVIAYGRGGALETVVDGETGLFFTEQSPAGLIEAIRDFESRYSDFSPKVIVENSKRFGRDRFLSEIRSFILHKQRQAAP